MRVLVLTALLIVCPLPAVGRPQVQFRARVDVVQVDVSVLDKNRRPVHGLTAADFVLLEDGLPQRVSAFTEVVLPDAEARSAAWMRRSPADVFANNVADGRLVVLLIDERSTNSPAAWRSAKVTAHAAVDQIGPADLAAVVYLANPGDGAEFTNDRARLHAAIERLQPPARLGASALRAMTQVSAALAAVPNRRKTLIYIGSGESLAPAALGAAFTPGRADPDGRSAREAAGDLAAEGEGTPFQRLRQLVKQAQLANVNLYLAMPGGLVVSRPGPAAIGAMGAAADPGVDLWSRQRDFMLAVARETGGRAVTATNAPERQMPAIFEENGSYYLLGFQSTNPRADGQLRKLEVKVNRKDVEVRARRSYVAPAAEATTGPTPIARAMDGLLPATDLQLSVAAAPFGSMIDLEAPIALTMRLPPGGSSGRGLAVLFNAFDDRGAPALTRRWTVSASARATNGDEPSVLHARVDLPPGRYDIRLSVQEAGAGAAGSVFASVDVPDAKKAPLSASGLVLEEPAAATGVLADDLPWFLPVRPTISRTFASSSTVAAFLRVYQGGAAVLQPVTIETTVLDARDGMIVRKSEPWDASKFSADRTATYRAPLSLAGLAPGPYLLKVRVAASQKVFVERAVPFTVK